MMMVHVPADGRKATVISIPRDSYVAIPGHGMNKINSAYPTGVTSANGSTSAGARPAVQTVSNLTGLTIDHFVQVDLLGFYRISNAIGGVPVNLCAPAKEANSGINLPAGVSVIKGTQALAFVRQRYGFPDGLGDLDRIRRQQYFLSAAFRKLSSAGVLLNPFKLQNLLKARVAVAVHGPVAGPAQAGRADAGAHRRQPHLLDHPDRRVRRRSGRR